MTTEEKPKGLKFTVRDGGQVNQDVKPVVTEEKEKVDAITNTTSSPRRKG